MLLGFDYVIADLLLDTTHALHTFLLGGTRVSLGLRAHSVPWALTILSHAYARVVFHQHSWLIKYVLSHSSLLLCLLRIWRGHVNLIILHNILAVLWKGHRQCHLHVLLILIILYLILLQVQILVLILVSLVLRC